MSSPPLAPSAPAPLSARPPGRFFFVGGQLALDFVNTRFQQRGRRVELLNDGVDLLDWLVLAGALDRAGAKRLAATATFAPPGGGGEAVEHALRFRGGLEKMVGAVARGRAPGAEIIRDINARLRERPGYPQLAATRGGGFHQHFQAVEANSPALLAPVAEAAADLLCRADLSLLRRCENPECILYFLDTTKNHTRRWCSMQGCGNRMKVAAYLQRKKARAA